MADVHSPWLDIPLADYEGHMSLPAIGQAGMLSTEFARLLAEFQPSSLAVIGCAGGNGFEHIRPAATRRVVGVDINPQYIQSLSSRFADKIPGLELHLCDVQAAPLPFEPVDFIFAALVFEYVAPAATLRNLKAACRAGGVLATVLQLPSASAAGVSPSPFTSLQALAPVMHFVSPGELSMHAAAVGFALISARQICLPSGKEFAVQAFRLADNPSMNRACA